ncbi:hypothetical protein CBFG_01179 [Clostridiales bacterium 1_7_47FAA]|nr:hypothetical protein CBFG_01179 [Clostridiales bacterium 1_7_47FAA]
MNYSHFIISQNHDNLNLISRPWVLFFLGLILPCTLFCPDSCHKTEDGNEFKYCPCTALVPHTPNLFYFHIVLISRQAPWPRPLKQFDAGGLPLDYIKSMHDCEK